MDFEGFGELSAGDAEALAGLLEFGGCHLSSTPPALDHDRGIGDAASPSLTGGPWAASWRFAVSWAIGMRKRLSGVLMAFECAMVNCQPTGAMRG